MMARFDAMAAPPAWARIRPRCDSAGGAANKTLRDTLSRSAGFGEAPQQVFSRGLWHCENSRCGHTCTACPNAQALKTVHFQASALREEFRMERCLQGTIRPSFTDGGFSKWKNEF